MAKLREQHDLMHEARVEQAYKKEARYLDDRKRREARVSDRAAKVTTQDQAIDGFENPVNEAADSVGGKEMPE